MREILINSAIKALDEISPPRGKVISARFRDLFISKMSSLFEGLDDDSDGSDGAQGETERLVQDDDKSQVEQSNLHAYLYHSAKLDQIKPYQDDGQTKANDILLHKLSINVLRRLLTEIEYVDQVAAGEQPANAPSKQIALSKKELAKQKEQAEDARSEQDEKILSMIDSAVLEEFASVGAVQTITKFYRSNQKTIKKKFDRSYIIENIILGGRTLITDVPDNVVMTPIGRLSKMLFYYTSNATLGAAFNVINFIFFGAMFFYVLQMPLLFLYRWYKYGWKDKRTTLSKDEIIFGLVGCAITALVAGATFVALFWPFVISIFTVALCAHIYNLKLTWNGRKETQEKYEKSLIEIQQLRRDIAIKKAERARLYKNFESNPSPTPEKRAEFVKKLEEINHEICILTRALENKVERHHDIRKEHEIAHNQSKWNLGVMAIVVASLVLLFCIASIPVFPPFVVLPALGVLVALGIIGLVLVIKKTQNKYRNEVKSEREHAVEVDIAENLDTHNDLDSQNILRPDLANKDKTDKEKDECTYQDLNDSSLSPEKAALANKSEAEKENIILLKSEAPNAVNAPVKASAFNNIGVLKFNIGGNKKNQKAKPVTDNVPVALSKTTIGLFSSKTARGYAEKHGVKNKQGVREGSRRLTNLVEKRRRLNDDIIDNANRRAESSATVSK